MDTEELADVVVQVGEMMPPELTSAQLASFIMTVTHAYVAADNVPDFLRQIADIGEEHMDATKKLMATKP